MGFHTVTVFDVNGCGTVTKPISVLGAPHFFTPNGDGNNDYWNIKGADAQHYGKSIIQIYDRYGKLITQITPASRGWDGNYNGHQAISDDYWYYIQLDNGRTARGHFALKR